MPKITRSTFLFLRGGAADFAQCGSCIFGKNFCAIMGGAKVSAKDGSCNFYIQGSPIYERDIASLTRSQAGYVERQVRCENCKYFERRRCGWYHELNAKFPDEIDLDERVEPADCCNANTPE